MVSIESAYVTSYFVINSDFGLAITVFEIFTFKARKMTCFSHPPLFNAA